MKARFPSDTGIIKELKSASLKFMSLSIPDIYLSGFVELAGAYRIAS